MTDMKKGLGQKFLFTNVAFDGENKPSAYGCSTLVGKLLPVFVDNVVESLLAHPSQQIPHLDQQMFSQISMGIVLGQCFANVLRNDKLQIL